VGGASREEDSVLDAGAVIRDWDGGGKAPVRGRWGRVRKKVWLIGVVNSGCHYSARVADSEPGGKARLSRCGKRGRQRKRGQKGHSLSPLTEEEELRLRDSCFSIDP